MLIGSRLRWLVKGFEKSFDSQLRIEISSKAITDNFNLFKDKTNQLIIPVLKSNAYGHGIYQVATILSSQPIIPYVAVDSYFEALKVRSVSKVPVLILGILEISNYKKMNFLDFTLVVGDQETILALIDTGKKVKIHLEINTGLNRYGSTPEEAVRLAKLIKGSKNLELEGVMSHLACSDDDDPANINQAVKIFDEAVRSIYELGLRPKLVHIAQTAGSLRAKSKYANCTRLGIGLYGINPFKEGHALYSELENKLKPALKLVAKITKVHNLKKGDKVGYNYTFVAEQPVKLAIAPIGYYEGLNRALSNSGSFTFKNKICPVVGKIYMNHTSVDISETTATVGDELVVYSDVVADKNSVSSIAVDRGLFNYELLTDLKKNIKRVVV